MFFCWSGLCVQHVHCATRQQSSNMNISMEISRLFDDDTCRHIEQYSGAVVISDQPGVLLLQASDDIHIETALSVVKDIVDKELHNSEGESNDGLMVYISELW